MIYAGSFYNRKQVNFMRIIGLTGSIACGKSVISQYLTERGYPVIDGDKLSRELTEPGSPALAEISETFGVRYINDNGNLNRRALGQLVFRDSNARNALDAIMAPYLMELTKQRLSYYEKTGAGLCFLDFPLLFEKGYDRLCSSVWCVWLPLRIQLDRLIARDGFTEEEAMARIRSVMSSDEKAARADHVIDNSGTLRQTLEVVEQLLDGEKNGFPAPHPQQVVSVPQIKTFPPPEVMKRPEAAKRKPSVRKAAWVLPVWIRNVLIAMCAFLLISITAFSLMSGYLKQQEEKHLKEQRAIDAAYPMVRDYRPIIEKYAAQYNLNPAFVTSVVLNESSFDRKAKSKVGASGLMQLMPDTAEWIAGKLKVPGYAFEMMTEPDMNIRFGCWYLNYLSRMFRGDPVCVISAYHAGQGQVQTWLSDRSISPDGVSIPLQNLPGGPTKKYAEKVTRDYGIYQEKHFAPAASDPDGSSGAV